MGHLTAEAIGLCVGWEHYTTPPGRPPHGVFGETDGNTNDYDQRMPPAKWTPDKATEREIRRLVTLHRRLAKAEAEYRAQLARLARPAGPAPIAHLAERLDVERKTVYHHLGHPMK